LDAVGLSGRPGLEIALVKALVQCKKKLQAVTERGVRGWKTRTMTEWAVGTKIFVGGVRTWPTGMERTIGQCELQNKVWQMMTGLCRPSRAKLWMRKLSKVWGNSPASCWACWVIRSNLAMANAIACLPKFPAWRQGSTRYRPIPTVITCTITSRYYSPPAVIVAVGVSPELSWSECFMHLLRHRMRLPCPSPGVIQKP